MNYLQRLLLIFLLLTAVSACSAPGAAETPTAEPATPASAATPTTISSSPEDNNLANTEWRLTSFGPAGAEMPVLEGTAVTLTFDAAGQAGGSGGCNSYGTDYQLQGNSLIFGDIVSTLMACAEESLTVQEQQYIAALQSAGQFELTADQLVIHYDNGQGVLNFVADDTVSNAPTPAGDENSLVGSQWQLESFGPTAAEMPVIASSTVTLEFDTAEQATGSGGCNTYGGNYTVQGDSISFGKIISTERACVEEGVTEQEQQYFAALQTAESFSQTAERLTILYDGGQNALNFVPTTAADDSSSSGEGFPPNNDVLLTIVTEDGMPIKWYQNGPPAS